MGARPKKFDRKTVCVFIAAIAFYFAYVGAIFAINASYGAIADIPKIVGGVTDFGGTDRDNRFTAIALSGEWEFFYNRWIVTDGDVEACDGYLSVPGRWTGIKRAGQKLPRFGYASYRLTVKNMAAGELVTCFCDNSAVALRMFVNGKLCSVSGTVSKDPAQTKTGAAQRLDYVVSDGGDVTLVIETGYTSSGGITHAPCLSKAMGPSAYWVFLERFVVAVLGVLFGLFIASLVMTFGFLRYDRDMTVPVLTGTLLLHFFFSKDVTKALGLYGYGAAWLPALVTGIATVVVFAAHIIRISGAVDKRLVISIGAVCGAAATVYGILYGTGFVIIPALVFLTAALFFLYPLLTCEKIQSKFKMLYALIYFFMICILTFEITDGVGLLAFGMEYIFSGALTVLITAQCLIAFWQLSDKMRRLLRMKELEREFENIKRRALASQIKPHFVFNSLTAIEAQYHKNINDGDKALESFAHHLRSNIDVVADGDELVPFDSEVRNILDYFELENLRADGALTLLLDLNETDFSVPLLSLQPFAENAVKHADTRSAIDGYIRLSSERSGNTVTVRITDNGKGFDTSLPARGVGIENARARLENLLKAQVSIGSKIGEGTEITVTIPIGDSVKEKI